MSIIIETLKNKTSHTHYTYILRCSDNTFYTGYTNDLEGRICAHNAGNGAKYTRGRLPVELVYYEEHESKSEAMRREWEIKRMSRADKIKTIGNN
jgi:putative endonuclease